MKLKEARAIIGSLGFPSKLPGSSYGLPAKACITGAKLARIPGTVCSSCYALSDCYTWTNPQKAQARRLAAISHPSWVDAMASVLTWAHAKRYRKIDLGLRGKKLARVGSRYRLNEMGYHRWNDSGDLQSVEHLSRICAVAERTPSIRHWLPTQELSMVKAFVSRGWKVPSNLIIRVSSIFFDDDYRRSWPYTSSVCRHKVPADAWICPAPTQRNTCGSCRKCWTTEPHIAYRAH